jgi:hypothetical protein
MKKKTVLSLLTTAAIAVGFSAPALADGGPMGFAGATAGFLVDVPEGIVVDSLYRMPKKCWHGLAVAFGDNPSSDFGLCYLGQQAMGIFVGIPFGVVWGIPYGAIHGAKHGIGSGWDKPFSGESFCVSEEK